MNIDIAAKVAAVRNRYNEARANLNSSEKNELSIIQKECEQAGHRLKLHQVVGEGRYCILCGIVDTSND